MFKKFKNDKYASIAFYAFMVICLTVLLIFTILNIGAIWDYVLNLIGAVAAFIYGFVVAYICNPIYKRLYTYVFPFVEKKKPRPKLRKTLALILTYIIFFCIIAIIVFSLIPSFTDNFKTLADNIETYIVNLQEDITEFFEDFSIDIPIFDSDDIIDAIEGLLYDENGKLIILQYIGPTAGIIINIGTNIVQHLVYFLIGLVLSVYFLMYKNSITAKIKKLFCAFFSKKTYSKLADFVTYTDKTFGRYLMGAILDSMLVGALVVIVLSIFQFKFAALIGVIVGLTNIIPFFGPFLGGIPSALIILIADSPFKMLLFIIIIVVLQQIDGNIINPHIVGATTGLTPLGVIASVTVCSHVLGFAGMVIGVPLCAVLSYVASQLVNNKLKKKNLAYNTELYKRPDVLNNEEFIKASLEVEAQNIIDAEEEKSREQAEKDNHSQALAEIQAHLEYVKAHPEEFVTEITVPEVEEDDDEDDDDYLDDF